MSDKPAPQAVLEFMSCDCTHSCNVNCQCVSNGLKCTDMCRLAECENRETVDMDEERLSDTDDNEEEEGEADEEEKFYSLCWHTVCCIRYVLVYSKYWTLYMVIILC